MATEEISDERKNYIAVQDIINVLLEFDAETRERILRTVSTFFGIETVGNGSPDASAQPSTTTPTFSNREDLSPKDFLYQKKPKTDVDKVACLAYYLTHFRNIAHFKTTDLSKLNTEAAQIKFANASNAVSNAARAGLLVPAARGAKQISAPGERYVDTLPDHAAARKVLSELAPRRRRKSTKAQTPSAKDSGPPDNG